MTMVKVLFVCLGNICRSPTAHGVFAQQVKASGLDSRISIDSAGTGDWHIGRAPDERTQGAALRRGYDLSSLRARQVSVEDFYQFQYILAMDRQNLADLRDLQPAGFNGHLGLFLEFADVRPVTEVPDPYYGEHDGFEQVLDLVEQASAGLLRQLRAELL